MNEAGPRIEPQNARGKFITLEGGEGTGKTTQLARILAWLQQLGIETVGTREPGGSPGAELLRGVLLSGTVSKLGPAAEAILFAAARIDHIATTIEPALAAGKFVVCDRYADSTRAYQGARGDIDPRFLRALERVTLGNVRPDLTLIFDLPAAEGLARAAARRKEDETPDRFEGEDLQFHENLRAAYLALAAAEPGRCTIIDASCTEEEVAQSVFEIISNRLLAPAAARLAQGS
ncbi:MAG: dTMP kinase [Beijerinckiaceae bacterium]|nr:dTMP kinase [Beijerinckiaceae bacterium]